MQQTEYQPSSVVQWLKRTFGLWELKPASKHRNGRPTWFRFELRGPQVEGYGGWGFGLYLFAGEDGPMVYFSPIYSRWFFPIPAYFSRFLQPDAVWGEEKRWGFHFTGNFSELAVHGHLGTETKLFDMPWVMQTYLVEARCNDGEYRTSPQEHTPEAPDAVRYECVPSTYTLRNGTVQRFTATLSVKRYKATANLLKKLGFELPLVTYYSLNAEFDTEVGEGVHDWKGGTLAVSMPMEGADRPREALQKWLDKGVH